MWLYAIAILLSTAALSIRHPKNSHVRHLFMVLAVATFAYWGADVFNSLWTGEPLGTGRVFYGALLGAALAAWLVVRELPKSERFDYWNSGAILCAFSYGILRIGCFLEGCCWGHITDLPWAVVYLDSTSVMPFKGVPVHPVQLYDAIFGILLAAILFFISRRPAGNAVLGFFILYPIGRFVTETFRGDDVRGINLVLGLSTSQLISVFILCGVGLWWLSQNYIPWVRRNTWPVSEPLADDAR